MASADTWRYGILRAAEQARTAARDESPYTGRPWDEWVRDHDKVISEAQADGYEPVIEPLISTHPHGGERDTFVSVLAEHLRARSWG